MYLNINGKVKYKMHQNEFKLQIILMVHKTNLTGEEIRIQIVPIILVFTRAVLTTNN